MQIYKRRQYLLSDQCLQLFRLILKIQKLKMKLLITIYIFVVAICAAVSGAVFDPAYQSLFLPYFIF